MKTTNLIASCITLVLMTTACAQDVTITSEKMSDNVTMIIGQGGNIGIYEGDTHLLMIDSQFGRITPQILAEIKSISDKPLQILLNTHHHGDHTGGNENIAKEGAAIYAHQNVRKRMKASIAEKGSPSETALPVLTFSDELNLYMDNNEVMVFHPEAAHTDGDTIIYFVEQNVLHTGDVYFKDRYPYVDINSGGDVKGAQKAIERMLMMINDDTQIIPGHGSRATKADLQRTLDMYKKSIVIISAEIAKGKTEDEVAKNESLTKDLDKDFYTEGAFISPERWRRTVYTSLTK